MRGTRLGLLALFAAMAFAGPAVLATVDPGPVAPATRSFPLAPRVIAAPGLVEPISGEHAVATVMRGRLKSVLVDEGDVVRKGQIIAELDNADLQARLAAAEALVAMRAAELERLRAGARTEERREAVAAVQEADAEVAMARSDAGRRNTLADKGVVSAQAMDQSKGALAAAEARRQMQQARLALVNAPPRPEDVAIAEANLAVARAEAAEARAMLEKTHIRAPLDGVVLHRLKRQGESVSDTPLETIVKIADTRRLQVRAEIDEADIARIELGQPAYVMADAYGDRRFSGRLAWISPRMGQKQAKTGLPTEKQDTKVLEALVEFGPEIRLPVGLRVDVFVEAEAAR